jgi:hypothetical protein
MPELNNISPVELTRFVNFFRDPDKNSWQYDPDEGRTMQSKQAEGAAYIFNLLNEKGIALLADEVGMGKTIQALAVMAALWQQKPLARILVFAPRNEIALNWLNEYETFIAVHYRQNDDIIKSAIGCEPIHPAIMCKNLFDLEDKVSERWGHLFIAKISSFSWVLHTDDKISDKNKLDFQESIPDNEINDLERSRNISAQIRLNIRSKLSENNKPPFDLMIIDEAHYFRNKNGDSLRVNSAAGFFGYGNEKIAQRVLLLTATPNHTSSNNIQSIVSYFDEDLAKLNYEEILHQISLRRFRRLSSNGYMKYNYRNEAPIKADFKDDLFAELFFGLYQKQLASEYDNVSCSGGRRNMLGFLEGTEFIPYERKDDETRKKDEEEDEELREGQDYLKGADYNLLIKLSSDFFNIFKRPPAHPKYEKLLEELVPASFTANSLNEKKLVFVRRIPSVREIANRALMQYDSIFCERITEIICRKIKLTDVKNRRKFERRIKNILGFHDEAVDLTGDNEFEDDTNETRKAVNVPGSAVFDLFKILKSTDSGIRATHAGNFRLRFSRSKPSIFNIFFAPASDYFSAPYQIKQVYRTVKSQDIFIDNYLLTCLNYRLKNLERNTQILLRKYLVGKDPDDKPESLAFTGELETLLTIFWKYVNESNHFNEDQKRELIDTYKQLNYFEKEAFSRFLEKGILLASTGLVELYSIFLKIQTKKDIQAYDLYTAFTKEVNKFFSKSVLPDIISKSLRNFQVICEKVFNLNTPEKLLNQEWQNFFDAQPAYPYSGSTQNQRVMTSFNTPFFPDILISTSVLQEGVNLQFFCDKVIHYGAAWTPGDNEQRVGRIDRMFSKVERKLEIDPDATLDIKYPFLKDTIDQESLANFILKKYNAEDLLDKCKVFTITPGYRPEEGTVENWEVYFRKPKKEKDQMPDPYPAKLDILSKPSFILKSDEKEPVIVERIINSFLDSKIPVFRSIKPRQQNQQDVCILNPVLKSGRGQPVFVRIKFAPLLSGLMNKIIYSLTLISPLGNRPGLRKYLSAYQKFKLKYEQEYLGSKLCLDETQGGSSQFGIYMKSELPIFIDDPEEPLGSYELISIFKDLVECSDIAESCAYENVQDIKLEELAGTIEPVLERTKSSLRSGEDGITISEPWKQMGQFIFLEGKVHQDEPVDLVKCWKLNHSNPFIKYQMDDKALKMIIPYKSIDLQEAERDLFNKLFRYYCEHAY